MNGKLTQLPATAASYSKQRGSERGNQSSAQRSVQGKTATNWTYYTHQLRERATLLGLPRLILGLALPVC